MSRSLVFAYPGDLSLKTGGYGYDRKVIDGLRSLGWQVKLLPLGDGFPAASKATLQQAKRPKEVERRSAKPLMGRPAGAGDR